jgi:putative phosphonate metabolism protein
MAERYAIYHAPVATGALWERAAAWLGRDAANGDDFDGPVAGIDRKRLLNLTQSANRYGFHATIKAPMALADGTAAADLHAALSAFASDRAPVNLGRLTLALIDGFIALIPASSSEALQDFAAHVVETFEPFRAPMSAKDRAARLAQGLTPRQEELLDGYGYPYVFDQFQLHMTLTDRLGPADRDDLFAAATTWFGPLLDQDMVLDSLSLFEEPERGRPFIRTADFALGTGQI